MKINTDPQKIKELLTRGVEEIIDKNHLEGRLKRGQCLRIKHGIDPTGPKIHLGRASQFWKLRGFQELGHQIVLIIGDFTGMIGDASDKDSLRPVLSEKQIKENMKDYAKQIGKILDMDKVELHYNSEWLDKLTAKDLIKLSMNFTAQQMIQRRNFKERWEESKEIGLHELSYPLLQGYDSVAVKADLELGGSDQLFNLLAGRDLQKSFGQEPQDIMTTKMLLGTDGRKMSTSWGNVITIMDGAEDIYGKVMSMRDECIPEYFELCAQTSLQEVQSIKTKLSGGRANPRDIKAKLAREIVSIYHGGAAARRAEEEFNRVFKKKEAPSEMTVVKIKAGKYPILDLLVRLKMALSKAEAKRLVVQGGVKIGGKTEKDWHKNIEALSGMVLQVGKRKFVKLENA
jgi:tyrosyl-tRNA synthetase